MNSFIHALLAEHNDTKEVTSIGETIAYTWFGRPNYAYSESAQKYWVGMTKDTSYGTTQHIIEYNIIEGTYTTTKLGSAYEKDDHNQCQILIRQSDSRLIACYTEHNGPALRLRVSTNPLDSLSWSPEITLNPFSNYSYMTPYQDSSGNIFIIFRVNLNDSGQGIHWYYIKSTDGANTFETPVKFYENGTTQNYVITCQDGNIIHFASTNGHPIAETVNVNIYHFYLDMTSESFYASDGTMLTTPISISDATPVHIPTYPDTSWILDIITKNGRPRIIYVLFPSGLTNQWINKELWFIEWDGNGWVNNKKIANTMTGYIETGANVSQKTYEGASRFCVVNPDIIWMPKQVNGILEIHKVDLNIVPTYIEQVTFNSIVNNWRPISVGSSINNLLWLRNNDYTRYFDYSITLMTKTEPI